MAGHQELLTFLVVYICLEGGFAYDDRQFSHSGKSLMTPELTTREQIDTQLGRSGWAVQTKDYLNLSASRGGAVCELTFTTGKPDYILFVDGKALGAVQAKPARHSLFQASINQEDVKRTPLPLSPLAEQTQIVAEVERRLSVVEVLESVVTANLQRANRLRQSIPQKEFTGKLI